MSFLLNQILGKISHHGLLRAPDDGGSTGGNAGGQQSQNSDDSQTGDDGDGDDGDDGDDDLGTDLGIDEEGDFDVGDYAGYQQTDEDKQNAVNLKTNLEGLLENMSLDDTVFGDDFDPTDPSQLKDAMIASNKQAAGQVLQMILPIVNHALGIAGKQMRHYMDSKAGQTKTQSSAAEAFNTLGFADKQQRIMGKTVFQQALRAQKGDVAKAVKATRKSFAAMGIQLKGGNMPSKNGGSGGRNQSSSNSATLQGADALTDLFGPMQTK